VRDWHCSCPRQGRAWAGGSRDTDSDPDARQLPSLRMGAETQELRNLNLNRWVLPGRAFKFKLASVGARRAGFGPSPGRTTDPSPAGPGLGQVPRPSARARPVSVLPEPRQGPLQAELERAGGAPADRARDSDGRSD
jgi:hypothetical protein